MKNYFPTSFHYKVRVFKNDSYNSAIENNCFYLLEILFSDGYKLNLLVNCNGTANCLKLLNEKIDAVLKTNVDAEGTYLLPFIYKRGYDGKVFYAGELKKADIPKNLYASINKCGKENVEKALQNLVILQEDTFTTISNKHKTLPRLRVKICNSGATIIISIRYKGHRKNIVFLTNFNVDGINITDSKQKRDSATDVVVSLNLKDYTETIRSKLVSVLSSIPNLRRIQFDLKDDFRSAYTFAPWDIREEIDCKVSFINVEKCYSGSLPNCYYEKTRPKVIRRKNYRGKKR